LIVQVLKSDEDAAKCCFKVNSSHGLKAGDFSLRPLYSSKQKIGYF